MNELVNRPHRRFGGVVRPLSPMRLKQLFLAHEINRRVDPRNVFRQPRFQFGQRQVGMLSRCLLLQMGRVPNARICPLFSALVWIKGTQKEIGALLFEQDQQNPEQQIRVNGGLVQRNVEILLYSSNPVKHRVAMGEERVAGSFERTAAGQVVVERFAILRILFLVVRRHHPDFPCDQIVAPLDVF